MFLHAISFKFGSGIVFIVYGLYYYYFIIIIIFNVLNWLFIDEILLFIPTVHNEENKIQWAKCIHLR
jgi:hypothetical protein